LRASKDLKDFSDFYQNFLMNVVIPTVYNDETDNLKYNPITNKFSYPSENDKNF